MGLTANSKMGVAAAVGILIVGFAVIIRSTMQDHVAGSIAGACLVMSGLTITVLVLCRHWIMDTRDERRVLAAAQRQADGERTRYIAVQAAFENEQVRLKRDMAAERARMAATLAAERKAMAAEFAETRATEMSDAFRAGAEMERAGMLKPARATTPGNLIQFPGQGQPAREPQRERSREHGVVGP